MRLLVILLGVAFVAAAEDERVTSTIENVVDVVAEYSKEAKKTLKIAIFAPQLANRMDIDPRVRVVPVNGSTGFAGEQLRRDQAEYAFYDFPFWDSRPRKRFIEMMPKSCELFIKNKEFLSHIEESKYDIAFTHMYNFCPIGIIHHTKIPTWVWLISGALMDQAAELMGVPVPPSYCAPIMMDAGDKMTFFERVKSFVGKAAFKFIWRKFTANKETEVFRAEFGEEFPDLVDLAASELSTRLEKAQSVVVMSFGSIAPMFLMPDHWKDAYFNAFAQFPDIQFFLRYENPEEIANILPSNVYAAKWLPQTDLFREKSDTSIDKFHFHPKTLGLISHGGYNSVQDVLHAGVPIMATGLFGDQCPYQPRKIRFSPSN
ncbi:hypothetical protein PRIPAC_77531, partial [Pristionchus pacificus]|uniref:glucuronosyltransferase n=1 Tax=Pristionchus pacificus TaxID=54126 RepID=A0A2A6C1X0_PRIPA